MRLPGYLIAFALGILLATTTPVGTGAGLHQFDLLHPLFSHAHLVNGRLVTHEDLAREGKPQPVTPGVNLGADNGASTAEGAVGLSPIVPVWALISAQSASAAAVVGGRLTPEGRTEAPPDPPPL